MIGPLSSQLNAIKWGEFRLGDLFEKLDLKFKKKIFNKQKDISKVQTSEFDLPLVNAKNGDNGIMYYGRSSDFESAEMTIDIVNDGAVSTANVYPQPLKTGVLYNAYLIKPKFTPTRETLLFFTPCIYKAIKLKFSYENKASWNKVKNELISLPLKPTAKTQTLKDIDFDFMEKFIAELEQCRLAELQAYLKATGLENTTLSSEEENALNVFNNSGEGGNTPCGLTWQSFKLGDLFEIEKTLSFNKDALTQGEDYDYITRTSQNQGVLQTTGFVNAENLNPPFTWSLGLLQMDFFYRKKSWYAGQFMRKITPKAEIKNKINSRTAHYCTTLLNALKRPLLSVLVRDIDKTFREQKIQLPLKPTANTQTLEDIDFDFMRTLINALMKQTIQGVAQYCGAKIQATKEIISQETPIQKDSLF
ncbi:restriction endonuclease subunit S [Helicobacter pylori]|uniref:restriction endonuclease subunit S n=1 Tax=Helicobacter pylori TaxID=210 RepID=UPI0009A3ECA8|nr:restriction endonuclease subunit S [Helicobacter pylori]NHB01942.1 restriction endonuclease subunit S [Helicobacter pylori]OPG48703.1 type I restriction endonuclease [Helicobacter pylori]